MLEVNIMRELIKQFVKICAETLPILEPIYEFGSLQVPGQEGFADLRPLFPGKKYVGADMREGPGVDVILNLHYIDLPSGSVGTVLILETLEHVEFPRKAIKEVHRILKSNGILIISSTMNWPIHDHPYDYWRFTPNAFLSLLKPFTSSFVDYAGDSDFPHTVVGVGFKGSISENVMHQFTRKLKHWKLYWSYHWSYLSEMGWKGLVKLFTPPILWNIYRKIRRAVFTHFSNPSGSGP
jgi:SAM-dependent methyltransferase